MTTPPFRGGQGRSSGDVRDSARALAFYLLLGVVLVAILAAA